MAFSKSDKRIVLTLDAGGTNFVFGAMQSGKEVVEPIEKPSNGSDLQLCLNTICVGFEEVIEKIKDKPCAISFAFPGPADYPNGIIGDLYNLPAFKGGVPLKAMLENRFDIPVFINNDGDLFAYGEALAGILPQINHALSKSGSTKRYKNLIGVTLGTGFGGGIVVDEKLLAGDNSLASEVWLLSNRNLSDGNAEEGISVRAVLNFYTLHSGDLNALHLTPKDIFEIATEKQKGNKDVALKAFENLGRCLGDSLANLLTIFDGVVVIGGGLTGASSLYMPAALDEINHHFFVTSKGDQMNRLVQKVFNYDNEVERDLFLKDYSKIIEVPGTRMNIHYDSFPRLAVATSQLGASRAISLGAYAYALNNL